MKKLIAITSLTAALLASGAAQADWRGNWLLGVEGGYNWYDGTFNHTIDVDSPSNPPPASFHHELDGKGWLWGLLGGYQVRCAEWLFGAEVNVDWNQHHNTQNYSETIDFNVVDIGVSTTARFKRDTTVGLTARVGYEVLPCFIPYLRAGVEYARDKLHVMAQDDSDATLNAEASHHAYRFVGGIGAEAPIPYLAGLTFRAEYNYHPGRTIDVAAPWDFQIVSSTANAKQHINTVKAAVVYNFTI